MLFSHPIRQHLLKDHCFSFSFYSLIMPRSASPFHSGQAHKSPSCAHLWGNSALPSQGFCMSLFLFAVTVILKQSILEKVLLDSIWGYSDWGREIMAKGPEGCSSHSQSESRERCMLGVCSLSSIYVAGNPSLWNVNAYFRGGAFLLTSLKCSWKLVHRHTQMSVSSVILNPSKLTKMAADLMGFNKPTPWRTGWLLLSRLSS